tara:strand:- start:4224 stop:6077 length:1854 start_codon:yes stop_codon:yes gene_type:complete
MASNLKTTELDFDDIKRNLKNFLKRQTVFNDYDFDGSGLNVLLDVLAYNTHYNAMAGHLALNEAFLDSAQIRGNAVSRARMLGYVPSSRLSPKAAVTIVINVTGVAGAKPTNLALPRGTKLSTSVDGETYQFVTLNTQSATIVGNTYTYTNVAIAEGNYNSIKYRVDNDIENQKHQIPHKNVDTSTLRTRVQANEESTSFDIFTLFTTLLNIDSSSKVYHLQENTSGFYEVYFGDGVTGTKPLNNNVVTLDYVYSNGTEANGASVFSMVDNIGGFSNVTVTTVTTAAGGSEGETLESIRYNAPLTYTSQNRAVTADDYRAIIQREFSNIDAISTWGGEDQAVPDYGKIFIAIKPKTADTLTDDEKATVTGTVLAGKNVVSITPTVVDPNYSFVELDVAFKYNPNLTDRTDIELKSVVSDVIDDYSLNDLNKFDGVFRHSALLRNIDSSDPSILNSTVRPFLFKNITPLITISNNFSLVYPGSFYVPGGATDTCIQSTSFLINGVETFFNDVAIPGSGNRKIFAYRLVGAEKVVTISDCGVVNPTEGTITLNSFIPDTTASIRISVTPESLDIAPKRDEILSIDSTRTTMSADKDTIATSGSSGSINYTTTSRFRSST